MGGQREKKWIGGWFYNKFEKYVMMISKSITNAFVKFLFSKKNLSLKLFPQNL